MTWTLFECRASTLALPNGVLVPDKEIQDMKKTKVSVGVCVRNCENLIIGAIDSIIEQDFRHELMEAIFVDDGSEDKTLSIIDSSIPRFDMITRVFHHKWKGLGATRNVVVNNANGDYIIWVDGDMTLSKDFVRNQVQFMDSNLDVGIGKGRYGMYEATSAVAFLENIWAVVQFRNCEKTTLPKPLGTGGSIYRAEAIKKVGGFDETIKGVGEDMDAEDRIEKAGWSLKITPAEFYERRRDSWKGLWKEYFWHGSGVHLIYHRTRSRDMLYKMFPPFAILIELLHSRAAYKQVHRKLVFLLPFHWIFKRTAWLLGFALGTLKI